MMSFKRLFAVVLYGFISSYTPFASAQGQEQPSTLVLQFEATHDLVEKERVLGRITQGGYAAGQQLLRVATTTADVDTRWLAIRGLGTLKFQDAAPLLIESLQSDEHYVRANAARALGEIRYSPARSALLHLLAVDQDAGVIEQTSLALRMLRAEEALPVLKSRMSFNSTHTRCWLLDAVARLGSRNDVSFVARYLHSSEAALDGTAICATDALAILTGEDFGLPKASGIFDPQASVLNARKWWEQMQKQYESR
jgi:hypothetical protein